MYQTLQKIRQQPKAKRDQIAFLGAVSITTCIALVWLSTLPERLAQTSQLVSTDTTVESDSVFRGFLDGVRERMQGSEEALSGLLETQQAAVVTATTSATTSVTKASGITVPQLTPANIQQVAPRVIQLGTSSATTTGVNTTE